MDPSNPWWISPSLRVDDGRLTMDGMPVADLAHTHGTPLYVYSRPTIVRQLDAMHETLSAACDAHRLYFAMKSNRHAGILKTIREAPGVGLDTCSPDEVDVALAAGFGADEISFNAGMLSNRDLDRLAASGVHCTLDSFSALRRYAERVPRGTPVGLRFDPAVSASYGYHPRMVYGKSKFGFDAAEARSAQRAAEAGGLVVDSVAMHIGWGLPEESASLLDEALSRLAVVARGVPGLKTVNVGGGLGGRYLASDVPLRLSTWAGAIARHLTPIGATIVCEPGTFIVAPAGILVAEVNTVERRRDIHWIGIDAGYALNPLPAMYDIPLEIIPVGNPLAAPAVSAHVAGHINEGLDIWAKSRALPKVSEGDLLAFFPAGAYGSSMASNHCLRGRFAEVLVG